MQRQRCVPVGHTPYVLCGHVRLLPNERGHGLDDDALLLERDLRENWQGEDFGGRRFAGGKIARAVAEEAEAFLHVQRDRVVDFTADLFGAEVADERIALPVGDADHVLIEYMPAVGKSPRFLHITSQVILVEQRVVALGGFLALFCPCL